MDEEVPKVLASQTTRGFLFADLRGYTDFVESWGDEAAATLLGEYRTLVRTSVEQFTGAEIRTEGDGFYVVFPSASAALRCAMQILERAAVDRADGSAQAIRVGIGVHAGETAETAEGLVGSAVNIAARVCSQARAGELLVTDTVRSLTRTVVPFRFEPRGTRRLKGIHESIALFRVLPITDATVPRGGPARALPQVPRGRVVAALVAATAVIVAATIAAAALQSVNRAGPTATVGGPASSPLGSDAASASEAAFPNPQEADLLADLPSAVRTGGRTSCRRADATEAARSAAVSLRCDLDPASADAEYVLFDRFAQLSTLNQVFQDRVSSSRLTEGDCATGPRAWQPWSLPRSFSGKLACFQDGDGRSWVWWTYDGSFILGRGTRPDAQWQKLFAWWQATANFLLR